MADQDTLPDPAMDTIDRYEAAPDNVLIPIPKEAPQGNPIRDDAQIQVSPLQASGYYVSIYNGPPDSSPDLGEYIAELVTEASLAKLEQMFSEVASEGVLGFVGLTVGVLISVFTSSPTLKEQYIRSRLDDGTQVTYAVLTPAE